MVATKRAHYELWMLQMADAEWRLDELRAAVDVYLEMLALEKRRIAYSKAAFRARLLTDILASRSSSSIEYRMQNISAVLQLEGWKFISGYKPAQNVGAQVHERLWNLIRSSPHSDALHVKDHIYFRELVASPDQLMGIKAVFGPMTSHVLCFGGRGTPQHRSYYAVPAAAARKAANQPFVVTIGGGRGVREHKDGCVLNVARLAAVYGPTSTLVSDPQEAARLAQWPVAIGVHDVWRFDDDPHLVHELAFRDRTILAGSQDGIVRPVPAIEQLWEALANKLLRVEILPLPGNFYDNGNPVLVGSTLPQMPTAIKKIEGNRVLKLQRSIERNRALSKAAKFLNLKKYGTYTCEACDFKHTHAVMFDAHHPRPLAVEKQMTEPEHLEILCPTCHRRAHAKEPLNPYSLHELRAWVRSGRP